VRRCTGWISAFPSMALSRCRSPWPIPLPEVVRNRPARSVRAAMGSPALCAAVTVPRLQHFLQVFAQACRASGRILFFQRPSPRDTSLAPFTRSAQPQGITKNRFLRSPPSAGRPAVPPAPPPLPWRDRELPLRSKAMTIGTRCCASSLRLTLDRGRPLMPCGTRHQWVRPSRRAIALGRCTAEGRAKSSA